MRSWLLVMLLIPGAAFAADAGVVDDVRPLLAAVFAVLGAFHLVLWRRLPAFREYLWYGLVALSLGLNAHLASGGTLLGFEDPGGRLLRANFHLGAGLFVRFLFSCLGRERPRWVRWLEGAQYVFALFMLPFAGDHPLIVQTLTPRLALVAVIALVCLGTALRDALAGGQEARLLTLAGTPLFVASVHDRVREASGVYGQGFSSYAFGIFVVGMSWVLADRVGRAYGDLAARERELSALNEATRRFVPFSFLRLLGRKDVREVELGDGVQREVTVLFSDIRSFTSLSERMSPEENFAFINAYLGRMEPCVEAAGGFIDKYIGDAVMALFPGSPDDGVKAAVAMHQSLAALNGERGAQGEVPLAIGVGINTGACMLGTIGGPSRMDGTVISDAVNLASRVEGLTKQYRSRVLLTEHTRAVLQGDWALREVDRVAVRGKQEPVRLFEVLDADPEPVRVGKLATRDRFARGLLAFREGGFEQAKLDFESCAAEVPGDGAAVLFVERCAALAAADPSSWDGVVRAWS